MSCPYHVEKKKGLSNREKNSATGEKELCKKYLSKIITVQPVGLDSRGPTLDYRQ